MPRNKKLTWTDATDLFETHLRARRSSGRTLADYLREVRLLRDHVAPLRPDQVRLPDLREYVTGLLSGTGSQSGRPVSANTTAKVVTVLRSFFSFLDEEEKLPQDPSRRLERPRRPARAPGNVLSLKEVKRLLATASGVKTPVGLRNLAIVETLYSTGLRRNELLALDLSDLDHPEREVVVRRGKGGKGRIVPLTRTAYGRLVDYLELARPALATSHPDSAAALFLSVRGRRLCEGSLRYVLNELADKAGISPKRLTPHTIRRSYASHLLKNGVGLRHIQLLLGHSSLNTTAIYLRLDRDETRREILLRHPRERFEV